MDYFKDDKENESEGKVDDASVPNPKHEVGLAELAITPIFEHQSGDEKAADATAGKANSGSLLSSAGTGTGSTQGESKDDSASDIKTSSWWNDAWSWLSDDSDKASSADTAKGICDSVFSDMGQPAQMVANDWSKVTADGSSYKVTTSSDKTNVKSLVRETSEDFTEIKKNGKEVYDKTTGRKMLVDEEGNFFSHDDKVDVYSKKNGEKRVVDRESGEITIYGTDKSITKIDKQTGVVSEAKPDGTVSQDFGFFKETNMVNDALASKRVQDAISKAQEGDEVRYKEGSIIKTAGGKIEIENLKPQIVKISEDADPEHKAEVDVASKRVRLHEHGQVKDMPIEEFKKLFNNNFAGVELDNKGQPKAHVEREDCEGHKRKGELEIKLASHSEPLTIKAKDVTGGVEGNTVVVKPGDKPGVTETEVTNNQGAVLKEYRIDSTDPHHHFQELDKSGKVVENYDLQTLTYSSSENGWSLGPTSLSLDNGKTVVSSDGTITSNGHVLHDGSSASQVAAVSEARQAAAAASEANSIVASVMGNPIMLNGGHISILNSAHAKASGALGACVTAGASDGIMSCINAMSAIEGQMSEVAQKVAVREQLYKEGVSGNDTLINDMMKSVGTGGNKTIAQAVEDGIKEDQPWRNPNLVSKMSA
jgi:hypothetical protein